MPLLSVLAQERTKLDEHEEFCRNNRELYHNYFKEKIGDIGAAQLLNDLEEATMRLLCQKSMVIKFDHGVSGKWTLDKARSLQAAWIRSVAASNNSLSDAVAKFGVGADTDMPDAKEVWCGLAREDQQCEFQSMLLFV